MNNKKSIIIGIAIGLTIIVWAGAFLLIKSIKANKGDNTKEPKEMTLLSLYDEDFNDLFRVNEDRIIKSMDGTTVLINSKAYLDFEAQTKFIGFYIPSTPLTYDICVNLADTYKTALEMSERNILEASKPGVQPTTNRELRFSGRVFIYHEYPILAAQKRKLFSSFESRGLSIQFRGQDYLFGRKKGEEH